jgi:putative redox protein
METYDLAVTFPDDHRVHAEIGGVLISTEGEGEPSPFDLFLAGIGTCSGYKVMVFCKERGIPTEALRIIQRMHYNKEINRIEKIEMQIHLPEGFPAEYHDAVVRAANTCGVKKHIMNPPEFEIYVTLPQVAQPE